MSGKFSDGTRSKNLQRQTSLQKLMHICSQGRQVFPYMFLRFQDFQITFSADLTKIISRIKSLLVLQLGVYLSICLLSFELLCCLIFSLTVLPSGTTFLMGCSAVVSMLAFQIFQDFSFGKTFRETFFTKRKSE